MLFCPRSGSESRAQSTLTDKTLGQNFCSKMLRDRLFRAQSEVVINGSVVGWAAEYVLQHIAMFHLYALCVGRAFME